MFKTIFKPDVSGKELIILFILLIITTSVFAQPSWQWATKAGGCDYDRGYGITIDDNRNTYVTGYFDGLATFGSYYLTSDVSTDIFVAKMDANGSWQWATKAGGCDYDEGRGITIDNTGNTYITGCFDGLVTFGSYSLISDGGKDIFVAKMDSNGSWKWATKAGGSSFDGGWGVTIDDDRNIYVTGFFRETATFGSYSITSDGDSDIFVAKMDSNGSWQWATKAGGSFNDGGKGIIIDDDANTYIAGIFKGTATFGSNFITSDGDYDIFVAKMGSDGNWQWATKAGGNDWDDGEGITIDDDRNIYVTGFFRETATFGSYSITGDGNGDIYVAKMDSNGNWQWAAKAGGSEFDRGEGITIDDERNTYVTGSFFGTSTFGSYSITSDYSYDIFVAKLDVNGNWQWVTKAGGCGINAGLGITIDEFENTYVIGDFDGTGTFGSYYITSYGDDDIFVAKLDVSQSINDDFTGSNKFIKQNSPNPFDINTSISYFIHHNCKVEIQVYNIKGELVKTIVDEYKQSGEYIVYFNGSELSSSIYFYKMDVDGINKAVKKMIVLR